MLMSWQQLFLLPISYSFVSLDTSYCPNPNEHKSHHLIMLTHVFHFYSSCAVRASSCVYKGENYDIPIIVY